MDCLKTGVEVLQEQQAKRGRNGAVQRPDPGWKQREGALLRGVQRCPAEGGTPLRDGYTRASNGQTWKKLLVISIHVRCKAYVK